MPSRNAKSSSKKTTTKKANGPCPRARREGCHGCDQCGGSCRGARALYNGNAFTGFVMPEGCTHPSDARRLHEVGGPLEGPSHKAEPVEFTLSMRAHEAEGGRIPPMPGVDSPCCADSFDKAVASLDPDGLVFGPFGFARPASRTPYFGAVRFDDKVFVKVEGEFVDAEGQTKCAREGFFARVLAVVPTTGECVVLPNPKKLYWLPLDVDIPYRIPHTAILAVERGTLW
jgi:hypothetical protein